MIRKCRVRGLNILFYAAYDSQGRLVAYGLDPPLGTAYCIRGKGEFLAVDYIIVKPEQVALAQAVMSEPALAYGMIGEWFRNSRYKYSARPIARSEIVWEDEDGMAGQSH